MPDPELMAQAAKLREQAAAMVRKADVLTNTADTLEAAALELDEGPMPPVQRRDTRGKPTRRGLIVDEPRSQRDD